VFDVGDSLVQDLEARPIVALAANIKKPPQCASSPSLASDDLPQVIIGNAHFESRLAAFISFTDFDLVWLVDEQRNNVEEKVSHRHLYATDLA